MTPATPRRRRRLRWLLAGTGMALVLVLLDLFGPWSADLRRFDPEAVARLETAMWRDYYDEKRVKLFLGLTRLLHEQYGFPPLRAAWNAARAARAAVLFQRGRGRADYETALPDLERYFAAIRQLGRLSCDPARVARLELEWWIAHRERARVGEAGLARAIADAAAALYGVPAGALEPYARARAMAMLDRDAHAERRGRPTEEEWRSIESRLVEAFRALRAAVGG